MNAKQIIKHLVDKANPKIAKVQAGFFKTGGGEYGYGDYFLGFRVGYLVDLAKKNMDLELWELQILLQSKYHEARTVALKILALNALSKRLAPDKRKQLFNFYLQNLKYVNNWDLVDMSAYQLVGFYLADKDRKILYKLAKSKNLWERRVSIISTFAFIRTSHLDDTYNLSEILLNDKEDLIHKAVGWMLREAGKRDVNKLRAFLQKHKVYMPRTTLRYAIEKFPEPERKKFLL